MTAMLTSRTTTTPPVRRTTGLRLSPIGAGRWRVLDAAGLIVGHIDTRDDPRGIRYRARRYHPGARSFIDLGEFWSADDALDCLRFTR
ncbi:hypothetical protein [Microbacterium elymi]|uniref:DNA mismatch repair protein n=1 Tax=Microbacterium elymi TaxID=2909587 RepID=A0ABY5NJB6_9MICO|nr:MULTISPECIES: hypothetical protein [Microbacterium]UUT35263.1 hypothetical protein L2X98_34320 [Microbacterium elymi]